MRPLRLFFISLVGLAVAAVTAAAAAETVRTVKAELSGLDVVRFAVENLLGTMRISIGTGDTVTVVATIYSESSSLADAVRLEKVAGDAGATTVRVRYPYEKVSTFRYQAPGYEGTDSFFFGFGSANSYGYDGHSVRVSPGRGSRLYADLEVRVPPGRLQASFHNLVGLVEADGLQGQLGFEVASADLRLRRLDGQISVSGSSGDTRARDIKGSWKSEFSSGDCVIDGFEGDVLSLTASSGDFVLKHVRARRAQIETSSGDARFRDADFEEFVSESTSGDVSLDAIGARLKEVQIKTSSGDVSLRLPAAAAFDVDAHQSSGDMYVHFNDGSAVRHRDVVVGYHHGKGGVQIRVTTTSGDLTISPG